MNPPFTLPGQREAWADHVLAVESHPDLLGCGGLIGAIVPRIVKTGKSKRVRAVRSILDGLDDVERGAFSKVGAKVSTVMIEIEKKCVERGG